MSTVHGTAIAAPPLTPAARRSDQVPPQAYFAVSALFHYLGPAFAVLLFVHVDPLGVTWLRIAGAAAVFAIWRPWRRFAVRRWDQWRLLLGLGAVLAAMNTTFYLAVDRLPLSTVGAVEFVGVVGLAAVGLRSRRNAAAFGLVVAGVAVLTDVRLAGEPLGFAFAFANCALFVGYVVMGHRVASRSRSDAAGPSAVDQLGVAMLLAAVVATPIGVHAAAPAFADPVLLLAGLGVAVCSSVVPYVCDQLAMTRLPRSTFALMLALLPVFAVAIGAVVLQQLPTVADLLGIAVVIAGVALHEVHDPKEER